MEKPDTVTHYEELVANGETLYFDPVELDEIYHYYVEINDLSKVEDVLRLALSLHPDDMIVKQLDAEYTLNCGDCNEALEKLDSIFSPDHPYQCILRSAALAKLGRTAEALDMAEQALIDEDPNEYVAYDLGLGFMNANQFVIAIRYFNRSLKDHPDDIKSLAGLLYCKSQPLMPHDVDELTDITERILALDPFNYEAWMAKGNIMLEKELYAEALDAYEYAVAIAPEEPDPLLMKAKCMEALEKTDEAITLLYEAASKAYDAQLAQIYCITAGLLYKLKREEEAREACWKSIEGDNISDPNLLMQAAYTFLELDARAEAVTLMRAAHEKSPNDPMIMHSLGEQLNFLDMHEEAAELYEEFFNVAPHASIMALWGGSLLSMGKYGEALKKFKKANEMEEMWQTYILMATCDVELKHFKKMEEHFRLAYALCPDEAEKLMESISPSIVKQMRENGFLEKVAKDREKWLRKNEDRLRLMAEEQKLKHERIQDLFNRTNDSEQI